VEQLYIQQKFLTFIASQLERFKQKGNSLWNCRCPYCGDSERNTSKARGYIYKTKTGLLSFQCHNCGENHKFKTFLRYLNPQLYKEYIFESFKGGSFQSQSETKEDKTPDIPEKEWMQYLTPMKDLSKIHPAVEYLKGRKIPKEKYGKFWYTANFRDFIEKLGIDMLVPDDARIILVETDKFNNLKLIIARAFKQSDLRYITLKVDNEYPKLFGLSGLDYTKPIHVVEGAIDSLFLDNCIATLDANLLSYKRFGLDIKNAIHIWDNEPRNKQVCRFMSDAIKQNEKVVIFPSHVQEKDINMMIENNIDVKTLIKNRTFYYVEALMEYSKWKRIETYVAKKTNYSMQSTKRAWAN
jgi:transcription elongation factor Elf1